MSRKQVEKMPSFDLETKQGKLFKALVVDGEALTESQIAKRFGIKNPTATISVMQFMLIPRKPATALS